MIYSRLLRETHNLKRERIISLYTLTQRYYIFLIDYGSVKYSIPLLEYFKRLIYLIGQNPIVLLIIDLLWWSDSKNSTFSSFLHSGVET